MSSCVCWPFRIRSSKPCRKGSFAALFCSSRITTLSNFSQSRLPISCRQCFCTFLSFGLFLTCSSVLLTEFDRLLLEAGGYGWDDTVKKGYLHAAINNELRERLITMDEAESYVDYCGQVKR